METKLSASLLFEKLIFAFVFAFACAFSSQAQVKIGGNPTEVTPGLCYSDGTKWVPAGNEYAEDQTLGTIAIFQVSTAAAHSHSVDISSTTAQSFNFLLQRISSDDNCSSRIVKITEIQN